MMNIFYIFIIKKYTYKTSMIIKGATPKDKLINL